MPAPALHVIKVGCDSSQPLPTVATITLVGDTGFTIQSLQSSLDFTTITLPHTLLPSELILVDYQIPGVSGKSAVMTITSDATVSPWIVNIEET